LGRFQERATKTLAMLKCFLLDRILVEYQFGFLPIYIYIYIYNLNFLKILILFFSGQYSSTCFLSFNTSLIYP